MNAPSTLAGVVLWPVAAMRVTKPPAGKASSTPLTPASLQNITQHAAGNFDHLYLKTHTSNKTPKLLAKMADQKYTQLAAMQKQAQYVDQQKLLLRRALDDDPVAAQEVANLTRLLKEGEHVVQGLTASLRTSKDKQKDAEANESKYRHELEKVSQREADLLQNISELRREKEQNQANTIRLLEMASQAAKTAESREAEYERKLEMMRLEIISERKRADAAELDHSREMALQAEREAASSEKHELSLVEVRLQLRDMKKRHEIDIAEMERLKVHLLNEKRAHARTRAAVLVHNVSRETAESAVQTEATNAAGKDLVDNATEKRGAPSNDRGHLDTNPSLNIDANAKLGGDDVVMRQVVPDPAMVVSSVSSSSSNVVHSSAPISNTMTVAIVTVRRALERTIDRRTPNTLAVAQVTVRRALERCIHRRASSPWPFSKLDPIYELGEEVLAPVLLVHSRASISNSMSVAMVTVRRALERTIDRRTPNTLAVAQVTVRKALEHCINRMVSCSLNSEEAHRQSEGGAARLSDSDDEAHRQSESELVIRRMVELALQRVVANHASKLQGHGPISMAVRSLVERAVKKVKLVNTRKGDEGQGD